MLRRSLAVAFAFGRHTTTEAKLFSLPKKFPTTHHVGAMGSGGLVAIQLSAGW